MKTYEIEDWALRVIQRLRAGGNVEDARIELKRELIDPEKAARRIAGRANSVRGEPILWIIGIDEKTRETFDVENDTAAWWSSVQSRFNGIPPAMTDVILSVDGKNIRALFFEPTGDRSLLRHQQALLNWKSLGAMELARGQQCETN